MLSSTTTKNDQKAFPILSNFSTIFYPPFFSIFGRDLPSPPIPSIPSIPPFCLSIYFIWFDSIWFLLVSFSKIFENNPQRNWVWWASSFWWSCAQIATTTASVFLSLKFFFLYFHFFGQPILVRVEWIDLEWLTVMTLNDWTASRLANTCYVNCATNLLHSEPSIHKILTSLVIIEWRQWRKRRENHCYFSWNEEW